MKLTRHDARDDLQIDFGTFLPHLLNDGRAMFHEVVM
jgi:hypothetical protein